MEKLPTLLTILLPVIGIIIGASLQYFFSKSVEKRKQLETLKTQAYIDYLRSVAQIAQFGTDESNKLIELKAALADAKTRSNSRESFLVVCNEMRRQSLGDAEIVETEKLNLILFGQED